MDEERSAPPAANEGALGNDSASTPRSSEARSSAKQSRWRVHLVWAVALVVAVVLAAVGTALVIRPYAQPTSHAAPVATYVAKDGVLGVTASTEATVTFLKGPPAVAPVPGTITSVGIGASGTISAGQEIYAVDLSPVFVAAGAVPAFRVMQRGDTGPDVAQLRAMLGLPTGQAFDYATYLAVRRWQTKNNQDATGVVNFGDVIFLPQLPTRGYLADGVVVGAQVSPGQVVVQTVQARPKIAVTDSGGTLGLKPGMTATLGSGKTAVTGTLGSPEGNGSNGVAYPVTAAGGLSPCDATCAAAFSITTTSQTPISVQTVPRTTGVLVPASALAVLPGGGSAVVKKKGATVPVTIVLQANGLAIVKGLAAGTTIRLFAKAAGG